MSKKLSRVVTILVCVVVLAVILTGAGVSWLFYRAMPDYAGTAVLPGLGASVHIVRDEHGVPHIFAATMDDAARALGYVHASERLFQMETQRRAGQGRLSEILGPDMLGVDKFIRTLGLYHLAEQSINSMSPEAQAFFQAYADGVNTWIDTHPNALPPEFILLNARPEPWKVADSIVWGKLMALQLSKNYATEILRAGLAKKLTTAQMTAIFPPTPINAPVTVEPEQKDYKTGNLKSSVMPAKAGIPFSYKLNGTSAFAEVTSFSNILNQLASVTGLDYPASNEWVISGSRTASGKPILANDPHLGLEAPILWYLARIVTPELSIEGATVPGLPVILLGQNNHVAWGFTTTGSDVQDLYIETTDSADPDSYLIPNGSLKFGARTEIIHVKGGKDVVLRVRATRHGPVLSDIDPDMQKIANDGDCGMIGETGGNTDRPITLRLCTNKVMAFAFTGLGARDTTSEALMRLNRATNAQEFVSVLHLYQAPPQNIVYADTQGNIGFINPGYAPVRKSGDGTVPVDGASGAYDWVRLVPFGLVPQITNPQAGFIFNANNAIVGPDFPYFMGVDWEEPWRAERLQQFFNADDKQTLDSSAKMQGDHVSLAAQAFLPYLVAQKPGNARAAEAVDMLRGWDGTMDKDRPEPLIFEAWLSEMHEHLLVDKTGSKLLERGPFAATSIDYILASYTKDWCAAPDCSDVIGQSLDEALALLTQRDGQDMKAWRWGDEHRAMLQNKFFSHVPVLRDLTKLDIPSSGDFHTLDRGGGFDPKPEHPFARTHGGGYRGLYDLGDPAQSRFMIATGQSGHIFSRHYGDLVSSWNNVESFTLTGTRDELVKKGLPELVLTPQ